MKENHALILFMSVLIISMFLIPILIKSYNANTKTASSKTYRTRSTTVTKNMSIQEIINQEPVNQQVLVKGTVVEILDDYVSKKGNIFQQFYISSGTNKLKVFCKINDTKFGVKEGGNVLITGKVIKFYKKLEISYCKEIKNLG